MGPENGYGYLELNADMLDKSGTSELVAFIEKPSVKLARDMLVAGNFLWNAGIFLFRAREMIDAFKAYAPETLDLVLKAIEHSSIDLGFTSWESPLVNALKILVSTMPSWKSSET